MTKFCVFFSDVLRKKIMSEDTQWKIQIKLTACNQPQGTFENHLNYDMELGRRLEKYGRKTNADVTFVSKYLNLILLV